jgi:hypothetical protein
MILYHTTIRHLVESILEHGLIPDAILLHQERWHAYEGVCLSKSRASWRETIARRHMADVEETVVFEVALPDGWELHEDPNALPVEGDKDESAVYSPERIPPTMLRLLVEQKATADSSAQ